MSAQQVRGNGKHSDRDVYVAWVLWLIGMSEPKIATVLMKRPKQISGIINRSPYTNRSAMSDDERQNKLNELLLIRIDSSGQPVDGGLLDRIPMKVIQLRGRQKK